MWLFSTKGFISVVQDRGNGQRLHIRSRYKEDLKRLFPGKTIIEYDYSDYQYRVLVYKSEFKQVLTKLVEDLDYDNFKSAVAESDEKRSQVYLEVWSTMLRATVAWLRDPYYKPLPNDRLD